MPAAATAGWYSGDRDDAARTGEMRQRERERVGTSSLYIRAVWCACAPFFSLSLLYRRVGIREPSLFLFILFSGTGVYVCVCLYVCEEGMEGEEEGRCVSSRVMLCVREEDNVGLFSAFF